MVAHRPCADAHPAPQALTGGHRIPNGPNNGRHALDKGARTGRQGSQQSESGEGGSRELVVGVPATNTLEHVIPRTKPTAYASGCRAPDRPLPVCFEFLDHAYVELRRRIGHRLVDGSGAQEPRRVRACTFPFTAVGSACRRCLATPMGAPASVAAMATTAAVMPSIALLARRSASLVAGRGLAGATAARVSAGLRAMGVTMAVFVRAPRAMVAAMVVMGTTGWCRVIAFTASRIAAFAWLIGIFPTIRCRVSRARTIMAVRTLFVVAVAVLMGRCRCRCISCFRLSAGGSGCAGDLGGRGGVAGAIFGS